MQQTLIYDSDWFDSDPGFVTPALDVTEYERLLVFIDLQSGVDPFDTVDLALNILDSAGATLCSSVFRANQSTSQSFVGHIGPEGAADLDIPLPQLVSITIPDNQGGDGRIRVFGK